MQTASIRNRPGRDAASSQAGPSSHQTPMSQHNQPNTTNCEPWFVTRSGIKFHPIHPAIEEIDLLDIAHGLAKTARFNGHTFEFYSVAQHSVIVSHHVPAEHALAALLHDASEAYIGDLIRPVKIQPELEGFRTIEDNLMRVICEYFNVPWPLAPCVKEADNITLYTEDRDLRNRAWTDRPTWPETIVPLEWRDALHLFMMRAGELLNNRSKA